MSFQREFEKLLLLHNTFNDLFEFAQNSSRFENVLEHPLVDNLSDYVRTRIEEFVEKYKSTKLKTPDGYKSITSFGWDGIFYFKDYNDIIRFHYSSIRSENE